MRAAVMYAPGDVRLEDRQKPDPAKGGVLLKVAAVGVCGSDIPRMLTKGAHRMPIICGHEFSGEVAARSWHKLASTPISACSGPARPGPASS